MGRYTWVIFAYRLVLAEVLYSSPKPKRGNVLVLLSLGVCLAPPVVLYPDAVLLRYSKRTPGVAEKYLPNRNIFSAKGATLVVVKSRLYPQSSEMERSK